MSAVLSGVQGKSDGKVYHNYKIDSEEEVAWHSACAWTANRLMEDQIKREELRD